MMMNTHDIELPPLPTPDADHYDSGTFAPVWKKGKMEAYALAAIEAYRKRKGEVVVTKTQDGEIIAVTRQDEEGRILSVIAEADSKRRGEPVDISSGWRKQFRESVYDNLAAADNQDIPLEEYPDRILEVLDSIVGPRHPTVVKWRNDAIRTCLSIAHKYCRDAETQRYLKQDLEALITTAPPIAAAQPAELATKACNQSLQPSWPVKVPTKWSGWACQYPGKMPRLYGGKSIAILNHHPEEGDRLLYLVEQSNPIPEPVKGPSDDELLDQALRERDAASEMADKLADAIAKHLGVEIGEHSSANHPWYRALDAIEIAQHAEPVKAKSVTEKWQDGDDSNMISRLDEPVKAPSDAEIREVFLENGFTIKPGQDDLKEYVYEAARALLARYGNAVQTNKETP